MDREIEKLWNSYIVQNMKSNIKNMYQSESISSEKMINKIFELCGEEFTKEFISWLYEYIIFAEKVAFETGYKIAKK